MQTRAFSKPEQRRLCLACELPACDPDSRRCGIRRRVNELQRKRYHANPERARASRQKAAMTAAQYEKKKAYMRRYYREHRDTILMKMRLREQAREG